MRYLDISSPEIPVKHANNEAETKALDAINGNANRWVDSPVIKIARDIYRFQIPIIIANANVKKTIVYGLVTLLSKM